MHLGRALSRTIPSSRPLRGSSGSDELCHRQCFFCLTRAPWGEHRRHRAWANPPAGAPPLAGLLPSMRIDEPRRKKKHTKSLRNIQFSDWQVGGGGVIDDMWGLLATVFRSYSCATKWLLAISQSTTQLFFHSPYITTTFAEAIAQPSMPLFHPNLLPFQNQCILQNLSIFPEFHKNTLYTKRALVRD
jgi:hypothetical protein